MGTAPFPLFGSVHLLILAAVPTAGLTLAALIRWRPGTEPGARLTLAVLLAVTKLVYLAYAGSRGWISIRHGLPIELCDVAGWLAVAVLAGAPSFAGELLYFVALTGTTQALLTPDLGASFPSFSAVTFFLAHGLTVAIVVFLLATKRLRPRRGAWWRSLLAVDAYAAVILGVDASTGANYLYLTRKPDVPTLLDVLGPWPWYLLSCELLAAGSFLLLQLPFRRVGGRA